MQVATENRDNFRRLKVELDQEMGVILEKLAYMRDKIKENVKNRNK